MTNYGISRRQLGKLALGTVAAAGVGSLPALGLVLRARPQERSEEDSPCAEKPSFTPSVNKAYSFLNGMMDAYAQGTVLRLSQSYTDQQGLESTGFVYDNSLVINAHLVRGRSEDVTRAIVLGKALLHAQQVDSIGDGRVRQAYFVNQP